MWDTHWIVLGGKGIDDILNMFGFDHPEVYTFSDLTRLNHLFKKIYTTLKSDRLYGNYYAGGFAYDFIVEFHRLANNKTTALESESSQTMITAVNYIDSHIKEGSYEMIVPFAEFMKVTPFEDEETGEDYYKEYLEKIDCLELCISGVNASTTMVITINDVIRSPDAHTFAECELPASAPSVPEDVATDTDTTADTAPSVDNALSADKGSPDTGIEGIAPVAGIGLILFSFLHIDKVYMEKPTALRLVRRSR